MPCAICGVLNGHTPYCEAAPFVGRVTLECDNCTEPYVALIWERMPERAGDYFTPPEPAQYDVDCEEVYRCACGEKHDGPYLERRALAQLEKQERGL